MAKDIEWVLIKKFGPEPIGAVGFIGDKVVTVIGFYDDRDGNQDGKVSAAEWLASKLSPISVEGRSVAEVAMQARIEPDVIMRDSSFPQMAAQIYLNFARGLLLDGIYAVYFARGVKMVGSGIAKMVTSGMIKEYVVRKGFEKAVREAFDTGTGR
ncbi:hypothetical protein C8J27_103298 [Rhodobacter aestuarii]|uniref:Uncharacterized protein n=1 Tax=Rhodobacter aestuarii TaxID=453582 RepID=A0A1N7JW65_9RHOB|nr:hypothetical protein [Rhodobacter aestuarii]PTV95967.1 hypothetical protein C8J27_103298 [Rhodobacter aestuarii]SIS53486.1 hypothetical protein SAMN05421580_102137 [Rhodobacter aestuarii]